MRTHWVLSFLTTCFILFFSNPFKTVIAQQKPLTATQSAGLELKEGERVVFLGNSLFENDYQFGYLELALSTRWPDRTITFRNLGWAGDNVYGVARSTITNPPTGYDLLMEHLTKAQPTLVFIGYGGIEAEGGETGLPVFLAGLSKLLDKTDQLGAKAILLSPIPILTTDPAYNAPARNAMLETYAAAIARLAKERGIQFVDVYTPMLELSKKAGITTNGIHLNEAGYYGLANALEQQLGLKPRQTSVTLSVDKNAAVLSGAGKINASESGKATLTFTAEATYLPLPPPTESVSLLTDAPLIRITGLKKGLYTLSGNGEMLATASASDWAAGVALMQGPWYEQVRQLRQLILKKNELFFFQYRPLNTTYILGFRSYEQGRHVKGLEEQSILIKWLEGQITLQRKPTPIVFQLTQIK